MDDRMTKFEEMRRKLQGQGEQAEPVSAPPPLTKFEELRLKEQSAQAQPAPAVSPLTKFEEMRRKLQAAPATPVKQTAPASQTVPVQQPVPTRSLAELTQEELQNRILLAEVTISEDRGRAELKLGYPPQGQPRLSLEELRDILGKRGVAQGIDEALLQQLAENPQYETVMIVARGASPVHGENGSLSCHFDTEHALMPVERGDGTVDHHNLNFIVNVEEGFVLCDILQPTQGQPGYDVTGRVRPARDGSPVVTPVGLNTALSADGQRLVATCGGAATMQAGKVRVDQKVELERVDSSTGNILFDFGSVTVKSDVKEGFCITAGGDITVGGNVEGAKLTAGGSITLKRGMNGLGGGVINAGAEVIANFLENIDINAKGNICADVIINCHINCKGDVLLKGPNANLVGGVCSTFGSLKAKDIGNDLDVVTKIELIGPRTIAKEREELTTKVEASAEEMRKLYKTAEAGVRARALITEKRSAEKAIVELQRLKDEAEGYQTRLDQLAVMVAEMGELGVVMAWGTMYPNVRLNMDTIKFNNSFQRPSCCAYYDQGEIGFRGGQKF